MDEKLFNGLKRALEIKKLQIKASKVKARRIKADEGSEQEQPAQQEEQGNQGDQEIIDKLQTLLKSEYQQWDMYYAYKDQLVGSDREIIIAHFEEHADDEAGHIGILQRYLFNTFHTLPAKERLEVPQLNSSAIGEVVTLQLKHEQDAVNNYTDFLNFLEERGGFSSLIIDIENILIKEQEHLHDFEAIVSKG